MTRKVSERDKALLKATAKKLASELRARRLPSVRVHDKLEPYPCEFTSGWMIDLATWQNRPTIAISFEKTMTDPERGFWVGFWSNNRKPIEALVASCDHSKRPLRRLRKPDLKLEDGRLRLLRPATDEELRHPFEEFYPADSGNYFGKYEPQPRKVDISAAADFIAQTVASAAESTARRSAAAAKKAYKRYVEAYELKITPKHDGLERSFKDYLSGLPAAAIRSNYESVDLKFKLDDQGLVLAELKPCNRDNARFAIRSAMGQLLDYRQRLLIEAKLLIVLQTKPAKNDAQLAIDNGFGIAYPSRSGFEVRWK